MYVITAEMTRSSADGCQTAYDQPDEARRPGRNDVRLVESGLSGICREYISACRRGSHQSWRNHKSLSQERDDERSISREVPATLTFGAATSPMLQGRTEGQMSVLGAEVGLVGSTKLTRRSSCSTDSRSGCVDAMPIAIKSKRRIGQSGAATRLIDPCHGTHVNDDDYRE